MKLESIYIEGFKAKKRFASVSFHEGNVTVIFGENGCGKTTLLKIISSFLSQDDSALKEMGVCVIKCRLIVQDEVLDICVSITEDNEFDWKDFDNSPLAYSRSISLGVERGISTQSTKIEPSTLYEFFQRTKYFKEYFRDITSPRTYRDTIFSVSEDLSRYLRFRRSKSARFSDDRDYYSDHLYLQSIKIENIEDMLVRRYHQARYAATKKIQSALFDTLSVAIDADINASKVTDEEKRDLGVKIRENKERLKEALDDGEDNNFKNRIISILDRINDASELEKVLDRPLLSQLLKNMVDELDVEKLMLGSINHLVEKFNQYLIGGKKLIVNEQEVYIEIDGDRHSVSDLSSGERHILTFLAMVLFVCENRNFLIIDEPEISLNIKWQRELMSTFSKLLPDTQIIVASHSPILAKKNPAILSELKVWRA